MFPLAGAVSKLDHVWICGAGLVGFLQICSPALGNQGNSAMWAKTHDGESPEFGWHPAAATSLWLVEGQQRLSGS